MLGTARRNSATMTCTGAANALFSELSTRGGHAEPDQIQGFLNAFAGKFRRHASGASSTQMVPCQPNGMKLLCKEAVPVNLELSIVLFVSLATPR